MDPAAVDFDEDLPLINADETDSHRVQRSPFARRLQEERLAKARDLKKRQEAADKKDASAGLVVLLDVL